MSIMRVIVIERVVTDRIMVVERAIIESSSISNDRAALVDRAMSPKQRVCAIKAQPRRAGKQDGFAPARKTVNAFSAAGGIAVAFQCNA
jgi:hypothetical protein